MLISIFTGIAAGALHVVSGADHLVAMAPLGLNSQNSRSALRNGLSWGFGHSTGVLILSSFTILIKDFANLERLSTLAEFCVGFALLVVGVIAIRKSFGLRIHTHKHSHNKGDMHDHIHIHFRGGKKHLIHHHAATSLGVLHGLAGASHLLAVIPALALPTFDAFAYMAAYLVGSIFSMVIFMVLISFAFLRLSKRLLPILFASAGFLSFFTGLFWLQKVSSY